MRICLPNCILAACLALGLAAGAVVPAAAAPSDVAEIAAPEQATPAPDHPDGGIALAGATNQATGDVLGLGYEQVVRLSGSKVEIVQPPTRGGAVLRSFEAGTATEWFGTFPDSAFASFTGKRNLMERVRSQPSRLAVLGDAIFVSSLKLKVDTINGAPISEFADLPDSAGSVVRRFSADGRLEGEREFPTGTAVTALAVSQFADHNYLAIGLNTRGVRVVDADEPRMADWRELHTDWDGRGTIFEDRDQVTALAFAEDAGDLLLVAGRLTTEDYAIVTSDLRVGATGIGAGNLLWKTAWRRLIDPVQWPDLIVSGRLGSERTPTIAIDWPTIGRVDLFEAANGTFRASSTTTPATAMRFFTGLQGEPRLALRRGVGTIVELNGAGQWSEPASFPNQHDLDWAVPGVRPTSLRVVNDTATELDLELATEAPAGVCWVAPADHPAVTVPAAGSAGPIQTARVMMTEGCGKNKDGNFYGSFGLRITRPDTGETHRLGFQAVLTAHDGLDHIVWDTKSGTPYTAKAKLVGDEVTITVQTR